MAKKKKISVKFVPIKADKGYSIYCRVTFNRKSTRFPLNIQYQTNKKPIEEVQKDIDNYGLIEPIFPHKRESFIWKKQLIEEIVRYEVQKVGEKYSIIGLSDRIKPYLTKALDHLVFKLYERLFKSLENTLTYRQYMDFKNRVSPIKGKYSFFSIFYHLNYLSKICDEPIKELLGGSFYYDLTAIGYLATFELTEQNKKPNEYIKYGAVPYTIWGISIGEWFTNMNSIRTQFNEFLQKNDCKKLLDSYSKGAYIETASKFGFDTDPLNFWDLEIVYYNLWKDLKDGFGEV